jgi:nitrogen regulatory protein PII
MKAVMIIYNQAHTERVEYLLDRLQVRGFTRWEAVQGRGSETGEPHLGNHTWPEMNSSTLTIVEDDQVEQILDKVKKLNSVNEEVGIRAFVWEICAAT